MQGSQSKLNYFSYDAQILFPVLLLVGIGIAMIYSASSTLARQTHGNDTYFFLRQAMFAGLGIGALIFGRYFPHRFYRPLAYPLAILALGLLTVVVVSGIGITAGGSTRWLRIQGIVFQPSEFARLAVVIFLAYSLHKKQDQVQTFRVGMLPHLLVLGVFALLLLLEPDFGAVVILFAIAWTMMFVGGVRLRHLLSPLPLVLIAGVILIIREPYRLERIKAIMDPWKYAANEGYQLVHSQMAFGTGGIWGTGIGNGFQKLFYLPEPHTDFIFSVIGEELGLMGVFFILALYYTIIRRGFAIAKSAPDRFGNLLAVGISTAVALQVCINVGVTLGIFPPKGLPLPLLSYGGTSLLITMGAMGILMNIARSGRST